MSKKGLTLRSQFYALIVGMTFFAFSAALVNSTLSLRGYLNQQLASHAQDAAHNLGLAISASGPDDSVLLRTLAQSLFDTGYYAKIYFEDNAGQVVINLQQQPDVTVPHWFAGRVPLTAPLMQSEVGDGWITTGTLTVQSNTGLALQTLWQQTLRNALSACVLFLLSAVAIHFMLRAILRPLQRITAQAQAVTQKDFQLLNTATHTRELRDVMSALNSMVQNINLVFSEQSQQAETLLKQAYLDPLTSLPNRRAFQQQLPSLRDEAILANNNLYVAMITLSSLQWVNEQLGYVSGDSYVQKAAQALQGLQHGKELTLYRLSGSEFLLVGLLTRQHALDIDAELQHQLAALDNTRYNNGFASAVSLLAPPNETIKNILARLDSLHTQDTVFMLSSSHLPDKTNEVAAVSRTEWEALIQRLLLSSPGSDESMQLLLLPVLDNGGKLLYAEALLRFMVDNRQLSTLEVLAMAQRLDLDQALEQKILEFSLSNIATLKGGMVALNISLAVLQSDNLRNWLLQQLDNQYHELPSLAVEIAESTLLQLPAQCHTFITELKQRNIKVIIERFGANLTSLHHIKGLNIDYVKLDAKLSADLEQENNRFIINTLTQICHSVGIKVLATHLENEDQLNQCKQLNINGFQGFFFGKTTNLTLLRKKHDAKSDKISYTFDIIFNPKGSLYDA